MIFLAQIDRGSIQELIGWFDTRINRYKNNETPLDRKPRPSTSVGCPKVRRTSGRQDVGCLDVRTSGRLDVLTLTSFSGTSRRWDVLTSGRPDVPTSGRPDVQTSGRPDVPTSGRRDVPTSGRPDVRTSAEIFGQQNFWANFFSAAAATAAAA